MPMAEATVLHAHASDVHPNWGQLASNTIDLGNAWMGLDAVDYTKKAASLLSTTVSKRLANVAVGLKDLLHSRGLIPNGLNPDVFGVPIDVAVQLITAVERLLALVGSCTNYYKLPAGSPRFTEINPPLQPAMEAATVISNICSIFFKIPSSQACASVWKKVMECSLGALETGSKTASLLFSSLTPHELHFLLTSEPVFASGNGFYLNECFSHVLLHSMLTLSYFNAVAPSEQGKLFVASGFLTLIEACAMLGHSKQGSWEMSIEFLPNLVASTPGVLLECLLTSDGRGLACLHSAAEVLGGEPVVSRENQKASFAMLGKLIKTDIPNIDDKDPARLKLRGQVLGLRGCGNIKCTTLRPSSKKSLGKLCAGCQIVRYCGAKCQKADWKGVHKGACKQFQAEANA